MPHEFLFRTQPIFDMTPVLPATGLVQTEYELRNNIVCRRRSTVSVLSYPPLTVMSAASMSRMPFMTLLPPLYFRVSLFTRIKQCGRLPRGLSEPRFEMRLAESCVIARN